ncbi:MAG: TRAP transporter small permease [Pseudomonadota bacterium]
MQGTIVNFFQRIDRIFAWVVDVLLVTILLSTVGITFLQVILRNFFNTGIPWAEIAGRNAVLWIAFLGAMLATRARQHLNIDAVAKLMPRKPRNALRVLLDAFAAVVCFFLAEAALTFVLGEKMMDTELFLGLKSWMVQAIIPFGFAMMCVEYCIGVVLDVLRIFDPNISRRKPAGGLT